MRYSLFLVALVVSAQSFAQVIYTEDFANGIPMDFSQGGQNDALWEYRGPATNPTSQVGSRGSCSVNSLPIASESFANGFMIFDSNYYDDPTGPCNENQGSGTVPAPHENWLATPIIDLTTYNAVGFRFSQACKMGQGVSRLQLSVQGGSWEDIYVNTLAPNEQTPFDDRVFINVSNNAAGNMVKFRFLFTGSYYFWMIDDISVIVLNDSDLAIQNPNYETFDPMSASNPTGFEGLEYSMMPLAQVKPIRMEATAQNVGFLGQGGVALHSTITNEANQVLFNETSETQVLPPPATIELRTDPYTPSELGMHTLHYEIISDNTDEAPENNEAEQTVEVTDDILARDKRAATGVFFPIVQDAAPQISLGNVMLLEAETDLLGMDVAVAQASQGNTMFASLYSVALNENVELTLVAESAPVEIDLSALNPQEGETMQRIMFEEEIQLQPNTPYFFAVSVPIGDIDTRFSLSGNSPAPTSLAAYTTTGNINVVAVSEMPMVRAVLGDFVGVEEVVQTALRFYPNPATEEVVLAGKTTNILLTDASGKIVWRSTTIGVNRRVDLRAFAQGVYQLSAEQDGVWTRAKLVIVR